MNIVLSFFQLMRIKQWVKNLLIFAAPLGGGILPSLSTLKIGILGFISFSLMASSIYVINDFRDRKIDREHLHKKNRPIASGKIKESYAIPFFVALVALSLLMIREFEFDVFLTIIFYSILNVFYTLKLKNIAILEIGVVASGYSLRIIFGAQIFSLSASSWLLVSTFAAAFGITAAKRKSELDGTTSQKRIVLTDYSSDGLQSLSTLAFGTAFTTYSLWLFEHDNGLQLLALTCTMLGLVLLSFLLVESERGKLESPEDLLNSSKFMAIFVIFAFLNMTLLYF